jgi:hypothetical protein
MEIQNNFVSYVQPLQPPQPQITQYIDDLEKNLQQFNFKESTSNSIKQQEIQLLVQLGTQRFTNIMHALYLQNTTKC